MKILFYSMLLIFIVSCQSKTSTPEEFINVNKVKKDVYKKDLSLLTVAIKVYYDSINSVLNPRYVTTLLGAKIDTVFYGNNGKIVFLALLTKKNEYAEKGMQYEGECYIAYKRNNIEFFDKLKYSSTSTESLEKASEMIRRIYLGEMNNIEGKYNINDTRFWDSRVWQEAKEMKEGRKSFEEMKKTHPENVYDPNDR
ncbi:hypothetical protein [Flavobacterium hibernum]|uniref:Lipoprotein n=1 Tax=Flavobacterium hibernum TaxID=37752 RepID=A0A0D0F406_9FLAO|nr:hypothetical protein [Flavobacterium hibernum]KIO52867.1 hypothetical protein IW18_10040 [Flavobacterium hibernum]OXA88509.1 hypothetical protein B0A73_07450 [Flavobacterium hibernum]PTT01106.1 hypothetical protein DBR27_12255 [Flavobacterium sp. HMWF030]STO15362.1 Uncharacterised protein [Flavobacterium hibernum]